MGNPTLGEANATVIIARDVWGRRYEVSIEPPSALHTLRTFHAHPEAVAFAEDLARSSGWPLCDRSGASEGT